MLCRSGTDTGGGRLDRQTDLAKALLSSSHILLVASKSNLE